MTMIKEELTLDEINKYVEEFKRECLDNPSPELSKIVLDYAFIQNEGDSVIQQEISKMLIEINFPNALEMALKKVEKDIISRKRMESILFPEGKDYAKDKAGNTIFKNLDGEKMLNDEKKYILKKINDLKD